MDNHEEEKEPLIAQSRAGEAGANLTDVFDHSLSAEIKTDECKECGMPILYAEYHPYAACLMFKACHDVETVQDNLDAVVAHGVELGGHRHCGGFIAAGSAWTAGLERCQPRLRKETR